MYDYIIIGGGISGCSISFELKKYSSNVLLIDKLNDVGLGASGAAGAFLSPLLGKSNEFKDLVTTALKYTINFYKQNTPNFIDNCGTIRIPKDEIDNKKFKDYKPYMDFEYFEKENGYFFPIGSVVNSYNICKYLSKNTNKLLNYNVTNIKYIDNIWIINNNIKTKNLILTTGASINLIDELYFNIKPIWGQRIDIQTTTCITNNYHKQCSVSRSFKKDKNINIVSIGATHHRNVLVKEIDKNDTKELLEKANNIIKLENIKVIKEIAGARAASIDYFPVIGRLINSKKTINNFPYLKYGTVVSEDKFTKYDKLFILNGVGGRGFVLAPYLANILVDFIINNKTMPYNIQSNRLFKRWVRKNV